MEKKKTTTKQNVTSRIPVVAIMGHVDHGKTTLLDYIRKTKVAEKEHGGITQHINSYQVDFQNKKITFIDTPGHEAFSAMRARGANVTDIAILVVAADDGVKPQTKESVSHIKAASIPFIVAINKMDLPTANLDRVKKGLAEIGVMVEGYGGDIVTVPVSAKTGQGVDELLEMINLVSEMTELKDESNENFEAVVIESSLDKFRGPVATVLVKKGSLEVGQQIKTGDGVSKVRALIDSNGAQVKLALVSTPVQILGFNKVPKVGEIITDPNIEREEEKKLDHEDNSSSSGFSINKNTEINLIVKADVAGSLEAITQSLAQLGDENHKVKIVHKETGEITESDVLLAASTNSIIIGFNVKLGKSAEKLADEEKVMIRTFSIIYELLDELKEGLDHLVNAKKEKVLGKGSIIAVFETSSGKVAGTKVNEGRLSKNDRVYVERNGEKLVDSNSRIKVIKHLKDEVNLAREKEECGILLDSNAEFAVGDIIVAIS